MELEFEGEGGVAEVSSGLDADTTMEVTPTDHAVRVELHTRSSHSEIDVGLGLDAEQARSVGHRLIALADELEDREDDEE